MKRTIRFLARLVAIIALALSTPAVVVGSILLYTQSKAEAEVCPCRGEPAIKPFAVFLGQVRERKGDGLVFQVNEVERGVIAADEPVEALDLELAPWRLYRIELFELGGRRYISGFHPPETLEVVIPAGIDSFGGLSWHTRMAAFGLVPFVLSATYLLASSWHQARKEEAGILVSGLRRLRRRRRPARAAV